MEPFIYSDFPDPDIIRVGNTYYMASTTMHFMPGCSILRSNDLKNWELVSQVYDTLEDTPGHKLDGASIYGQGMWAPSLRFKDGTFFLLFAANDTRKTYLFTASDPTGEWQKSFVEGFYHDASLFFDEDGRNYLVYGNKTINLIELKEDLSGPLPSGRQRVLVEDTGDVILGYEGAHFQKVNGTYYLFLINWPRTGTNRRTASCFKSETLDGEFEGRVIIDEDLNFHNQGVAQGGMVDTPDGHWYLFMFQDRGAVGRVSILLPMEFSEGFPSVKAQNQAPILETSNQSLTLNGSDLSAPLKPYWHFNHRPDTSLFNLETGYEVTTGKLAQNLTQASNTLCQRAVGPKSGATVTVDGSQMKDGDYAGLCVLQGSYGAIALLKEKGAYYLVTMERPVDYEATMGRVWDDNPPVIYTKSLLDNPVATVQIQGDFEDLKDEATFFYQGKQVGPPHKLAFKLDHFTGCRYGLFYYSTEEAGGKVNFTDFKYDLTLKGQ